MLLGKNDIVCMFAFSVVASFLDIQVKGKEDAE